MNVDAYEVVADMGRTVINATIFAPSEKRARRVMWELLDEDTKNAIESLEVVWNYRADGPHIFCKRPLV